MKNLSKVLATLAIGAVAGGILGLLFAPDKGTTTRKKLASKGKKAFKKVNQQTGKEGLAIAKEKLEKHLKKINDKLHQAASNDSVTS